jgi:hypothetical protein
VLYSRQQRHHQAGKNIPTGNLTSSAIGGNFGNITNIDGGNITTGNLTTSAPGAIAQLEQRRDKEFADYFGQNLSNQLTSVESIRDALSTIASQIGNRSAIITQVAT